MHESGRSGGGGAASAECGWTGNGLPVDCDFAAAGGNRHRSADIRRSQRPSVCAPDGPEEPQPAAAVSCGIVLPG